MTTPSPMSAPARSSPYGWPQKAGLLTGLILFVALLLLPLPGLPREVHRLVAVLALVIVFWVTEAIPLAATALIGPALCVVLGVAPERQVLAPFGSPVVFMYLGMFFLAAGMQKHGLDRRLALTILALPGVGRTPWRVFAALGFLTAALSMWMNNLSTTAVILPIAMGVLHTSRAIAGSAPSREALVLLIAFSASVGGLGTPVGTAPNLITIAHLQQLTGERVSTVRWMLLAAPLVLLLMAYLLWQLRPRCGSARDESGALEREFAEQRRRLGPWKRGEIVTALSLGTAILLWLGPGIAELFQAQLGATKWPRIPEEMVGFCAGLVLFLAPVDFKRGDFTLNWRDAATIDWGTVMLAAGGLALGALIFSTGLAKVMGDGMAGLLGTTSLWGIVAVGILLSVALSEIASNTAAANVTVPLMIAVAQSAGVNPVPVALGCCLACSFGFMLPVSTGPNALAYATGEVRIAGMIRHGLALDAVGIVLIWLTLRFLGPPLGWV